MSHWYRAFVVVVGMIPALDLSGQAGRIRLQVPLAKQPYNLCLPTSVSMVLSYWGLEVTAQSIGDQVTTYKGGTTGQELLRVVDQMGFRGFLIQPEFEDLLLHLERGRPLIIQLPNGASVRHAMVLVGFDFGAKVVWLNDPASGGTTSLAASSFRRDWSAAGRWTLLILPK